MSNESKMHTVPFTREWWENIWYYYKVAIVVGFILIIAIAGVIVECANQIGRAHV